MKEKFIKELNEEHIEEILKLTKQLNADISLADLQDRQLRMFGFLNYKCFGFFEGEKLIGISSGWITVRLYSGMQLEIDNVVIDNAIQSKGYGRMFLKELEYWAKKNDCKTVELNTYIQNDRSHKFYFNQGYSILGFHFQKHL